VLTLNIRGEQLYLRAQQVPAHTYALVIDEINRGNISKMSVVT
jgi:hypothetical protein